MLRHWSIRYFFVVVASMVLVAMATLFSVNRVHVENQSEALATFVRAVAREPSAPGGGETRDAEWRAALQRGMAEAGFPQVQPVVFVLDEAGHVMRQAPEQPVREALLVLEAMTVEPGAYGKVQRIEPVEGDNRSWLAALEPLEHGGTPGHAVAVMPLEMVMPAVERFRLVRLAGTTTVIVVGWGVVYLMTRRLVAPIRSAADAVRRIAAGRYDVKLDRGKGQPKEIAELMDAFADMAERLREHEALRRQLLAGVTHELRTPITSISGLLQAVRDKVVTGEEAELFLRNAMKQTDRLQKLVEDLLEFNRFSAQEITVRLTHADLFTLVGEIVRRWHDGQGEAAAGLSLCLEADEEEDWSVRTDPDRIEQVLVNLLNNARDEMRDGGTVRIGLVCEGDAFLVQVADTGAGIPEGEQLHLFEPYFRGERKKRQIRGLGLGLPFSRLIARSLGGDLVLAKSDASGSTFVLKLPRESR
jgi:signal transduction histidine kinase